MIKTKPERYKRWVKAALQRLEGLLRLLAQIENCVGRDQEGGVGPLVAVEAGVVHDLLLRQGVGLQLAVHFRTEPDAREN